MSEVCKSNEFIVFSETWNNIKVPSPSVMSRYGRTHKRKRNDDFVNYDSETDGRESREFTMSNNSDKINVDHNQNSGRNSINTAKEVHVTANTIIEEFDDDYESPLAINERKFFKSPNKHFKSQYIHDNYLKNHSKIENGNNVPVDMSDVLKIVTSKSPDNYEERNTSAKKPLKTYGSKKKSTDNFILETFGLPDDPLLPFISNTEIKEEPTEEETDNAEVDKIVDSCWHSNLVECLKEENVNDVKLNVIEESINSQNQDDTDEVHAGENKSDPLNSEEGIPFKIGDIAWARIGNMPFWPCLCVEDPETSMFIKRFGNRHNTIKCHVRFFADNGRRAWANSKHMLPFLGANEINMKKLNFSKKQQMSFSSLKPRWKVAVAEAEVMLTKNVLERQQFFEDVLKNIKSFRDAVRLQKKHNRDKASEEEETQNKLIKKRKQSDSSTTSSSETDKNALENERDSNKDIIDAAHVDEKNNGPVIKRTQSHVSTCTLEDMDALYKRCIFRGISKQKVCEICQEKNNTLKCSVCQGVFHIKCQENLFKNDENNGPLGIGLVQIIDSKSKKINNYQLHITSDLDNMNLNEKIDMKMREIMRSFEDNDIIYADSTTDSSSCEGTFNNQMTTADYGVHSEKNNLFKCYYCTTDLEPPCSICLQHVSKKGSKALQQCSHSKCKKYYHQECLKLCLQTRWSFANKLHKESNECFDSFVCPSHMCHTCSAVSFDRHKKNLRMARCIKCPGAYHLTNFCLPAGTHILSTSQIICPRHVDQNKRTRPINTNWCFICSKGGNLICCDSCPTSVHIECMQIDIGKDDSFICEECQSGRFPLYNEVVWVKLGSYRWWPARTIFPSEIPDKIVNLKHEKHDFVVKFFATNNYNWIGRGRVFLFEEDDYRETFRGKTNMDFRYKSALKEATMYLKIITEFKATQFNSFKSSLRPPTYVQIKVNRPIGNLKISDGNDSVTTACECKATDENPCGPESDCLNRLLLTECNPEICPAGEKCTNQRFEKRLYPPLVPCKTDIRGWGLQCLEPLHKGQFVIEYVGEVIDEQEYQRRVKKMTEQNNDNYYFLTIDKDRIIDAGPKGNLARFMNHSCKPNCETQKWTVNGDTRVGLFTLKDIPANHELTFNYNLSYIGKEMRACKCGAPNCAGFIGLKPTQNEKQPKSKRRKLKKSTTPQLPIDEDKECFICGLPGDVISCSNKICNKFYHLNCVNLETCPDGRWTCPWHNCNVCTKRTIRCCTMCVNSYCPSHADGNVKHHMNLGYLCSKHDPEKLNDMVSTQEELITSTTTDSTSNFQTEAADVTDTTIVESHTTADNSMAINIEEALLLNTECVSESKRKRGPRRKRLTKAGEPKIRKSRRKLQNGKELDDSSERISGDIVNR